MHFQNEQVISFLLRNHLIVTTVQQNHCLWGILRGWGFVWLLVVGKSVACEGCVADWWLEGHGGDGPHFIHLKFGAIPGTLFIFFIF